MTVAYLLNLSMAGNAIDSNVNEIIQIHSSFINDECSFIQHKLNIDDSLSNQRPVSYSSQLYTCIDDEFLKNNAKSKDETLIRLARTLLLLIDKNIPIICWNASDVILSAVKSNLNGIVDENDINKIVNYKNTIDIKRIAEICIPVSQLLGSNYSIDTLCYMFEKNLDSNFSRNDFQIKYVRPRENPAKHTSIISNSMIFILKTLMNQNNLHCIDDILSFLSKPHIIQRMPFGKYKDVLISDILKNDIQYIHWLKKSSNALNENVDLKFTIETLLNNVQ